MNRGALAIVLIWVVIGCACVLLSGCMSIAVSNLGQRALDRCQSVAHLDVRGGDVLAAPGITVTCTTDRGEN